MSRQSKRAAFAHRQRVRRGIDRVARQHRGTPGFLGVCTSFSISVNAPGGQVTHLAGLGALFINPKRAA